MANALRSLPSVDRLLSDERIARLTETYSRQAVLDLVREQLDNVRVEVTNGGAAPDVEELVHAIEMWADERWGPWPRPVINATGVVLHTNLGRAPLSDDAIEAMRTAGMGYSDLELDLGTGTRGSRQAYISRLVSQLTGADSALVVNNNASALLLGLAAIAAGREVIVSRGEAVEIGGGFRIPDVLRQSGATLIEVGTTNRTYDRDYEAAISDETGAILAVHASNFKVTGFTHSPEILELAQLGQKHGIPVLHDLGSGCLLDTSAYGLAHEPMPQESIKAEAGLAFFSGDKLLGGPQAGIIAGRRDLVSRVGQHPMARAVRIDKLSMAALSATLLHYVKDEATSRVPVWQMIAADPGGLETRAQSWSKSLGHRTSVSHSVSTVGGGSLPGETLPSRVVAIDPGTSGTANDIAARLRGGNPPVVGRIEDGKVLLDPRTVLPRDDDALLRVATRALG
jgi:L-seryl-tRNA(Ser) seleniumtransferase